MNSLGTIVKISVGFIISALFVALISQTIFTERSKKTNEYLNKMEDNLKRQVEIILQASNTLATTEKIIRVRIEKERIASERLALIDSKSFEDYCNENRRSPEEFIAQEVKGEALIKFNDISSTNRLVGIIKTKAKIDLLINTPLEATRIVGFKERVTIVNPDAQFTGYIHVENTGFYLIPKETKK